MLQERLFKDSPLRMLASIMRAFRWSRRWFYQHLFAALTVVGCVTVFFFVPQVQRIWASQTPLPHSSVWIINWTAAAIFLAADMMFYVLSMLVVPRADLPTDISWQRMNAANRGRPTKAFARFSDVCLWLMNFLVGWLVFARDQILRHRTLPTVVLGIALTLIGAIGLWYGPADDSSRMYLLAGALCHNIGIWCLMAGCWLLAAAMLIGPNPLFINSGRQRDLVLIVLGRLIAWLFVANLIGELLWASASWSQFTETSIFSFRLYTLWALLHILALLTVLAGTADYLDRKTDFPARILTVVTVFFIAVLVRPVFNSDVQLVAVAAKETSVPDPTADTARRRIPAHIAARSEQWYKTVENRLLSIPEDDPVLVIAISGGGSRAAIFSALVLEYLAQKEIPGTWNEQTKRPRRWGDNILLMSSVSGGSLAAAHFANRGCQESALQAASRFTIQPELIDGLTREINRLGELENRARSGDDWEQTFRFATEVQHSIDELGDQSPYAWLFRKQFIDEMCVNFMAPILRGSTAARLYRGDALGRFWSELYGWERASNIEGYDAAGSWQASGAKYPALLLNTSDVSRGARLVIGFPPLPHNIFPSETAKLESAIVDQPEPESAADGPLHQTADSRGRPEPLSRHPPQEIVHLHPMFEPKVGLSKAVRLSSNFPWGFFSSKIQFPVPADEDDRNEPILVLDGGIVDNTGIDTIFDVYHGLQASPRGRKLLSLLVRRRVVLLEIDSGSKPSPAGWLTRMLGGSLEPIQALNNAAYTNADRTKNFYVEQLRTEIESGDEADPIVLQVTSEGARPGPRAAFFYLKVECNHFSPDSPDQGEVMTAWALSAREKSSVMARFVYAMWPLEQKLKKLEQARESAAEAKQIADALRPAEITVREVGENVRIERNRTAGVLDWVERAKAHPPAAVADEYWTTLLRQQQNLRAARLVVENLTHEQGVKLPELVAITEDLNRWEQDLAQCSQLYVDKFKSTVASAGPTVLTPSQVAGSKNDWGNVSAQALMQKSVLLSTTPADREQLRRDLQTATAKTERSRKTIQELNNKSREWFDSPSKKKLPAKKD